MKKTNRFNQLAQKLIFLLLLSINLCFSHAHIFIDYKVHACVSNKGLDGVFVNWTFDRIFTQVIQKEFDIDKDNKLNKKEQLAVFDKFNSDYAKYNYHLVIKIGGKNYSIPKPTNFSARFIPNKDVVAYTFFLPLNLKAENKESEVQVYFFDPVIFVSFTILPKDISIQNKSQNIKASISLKKVKYLNCPTIIVKANS